MYVHYIWTMSRADMLRKKIEGETQNLAEMISFIMYLQHLARSLAQITGSIKVYCIHELNRFFFFLLTINQHYPCCTKAKRDTQVFHTAGGRRRRKRDKEMKNALFYTSVTFVSLPRPSPALL